MNRINEILKEIEYEQTVINNLLKTEEKLLLYIAQTRVFLLYKELEMAKKELV